MKRPKKFDPYEVLDVARDATPEQIKAAGKKGARKTHPDAGGSKDAFYANRRALAILLDPAKREKFDSTGDADEDKPDNAVASAMGAIEAEMVKILNAYLNNNLNSQLDPCRFNMVAKIRGQLNGNIREMNKSLALGKRYVEFMIRFAPRWTKKNKTNKMTFDFLQRRFADRLDNAKQQIADVEDKIRVQKLAIELIDDYEFAADVPVASAWTGQTYPGSGFVTLTGT